MTDLRVRGAMHVAIGLVLVASWHAPSAAQTDLSPPFTRALSYYARLQPRVLWVDATANLSRITHRAGVADIVENARRSNVNIIVVDVKPISGQVLYPSAIAERMTSWRGQTYPEFDVLQAFIEEAHKAGIEVAASLNVLAEGHKMFGVGKAYQKRDWQAVVLTVQRSLRSPDGARLRVRGAEDPEEVGTTLVQGPETLIEGTSTPGQELAVVLEHSGRVAGMVDPALLGDVPLAPPDEGRMLLLRDDARTWATSHLRAGDTARFEAVTRLVPITEAPGERIAAFVNPLHAEARNHQLALIREIVQRYDIDGIVLDRTRYASLYADFGPIMRNAFERWLGQFIERWPDDVLAISPIPGESVRPGRHFKAWLEFRARVIRDLVRDIRETVKQVKPNVTLGAYVGSWFSEYYGVGVNWASERYPVGYSWASQAYNEAGYAELLDWLTTGCYYGIPTRDQARALGQREGATVETAAILSTRVVANAVPVAAGLYALNYEGRPADFRSAMDVAMRRSAGVMLFDTSHIYDYGWWDIVAQAMPDQAYPLHACAGLLSQLRSAHDAVVGVGEPDPLASRMPIVPYQPGGG
ncbi:MAG: family 10 glycosylhydrolase [Chthonomonadales bacterium]|nr:family 10 glycosylhydrolase [Chthonomonadales bacterium]